MAASETAPVAVTEMSLFKIERDLAILVEAREEADCDEGREACDRAIAEYVVRECQKVDGIRSYLRHCEVMIAAAKEEANRQKERAEKWSDRATALKQACMIALEAAGKKSVEGRTGKLAIRNNGGKAPLDVYDQAQVPTRYEVVTVDVDRAKIREDLERGVEVPGARLLDRGRHLNIT